MLGHVKSKRGRISVEEMSSRKEDGSKFLREVAILKSFLIILYLFASPPSDKCTIDYIIKVQFCLLVDFFLL